MNKYLYTNLHDYVADMVAQTSGQHCYDRVDFYPFLKRKGFCDDFPNERWFNLWTGFPLETVPLRTPIDFRNSNLYQHIRDELINGDIGEFNHFLDWVADLIQDPAHMKPTSHVFYSDQGVGKGMLGEFFEHLLANIEFVHICHQKYFSASSIKAKKICCLKYWRKLLRRESCS